MERKFLHLKSLVIKIDFLENISIQVQKNLSITRIVVTLLVIGGLSVSCKSKKIGREDPAFTVITTAKSYQGTPYKYGGTTRAGMDCSALIYHSFYAIGINMPRTSAAQSEQGKSVKKNEVKPGDVLFFATGRRRKQVTHAGIVTEASRSDIRFIHSSTSLGVSEDYLSNSYWSKAFLFARRILD